MCGGALLRLLARLATLPAVAVIAGGVWLLHEADPARNPTLLAWKIANEGRPNSAERSLELYTAAMLRDSADPYRWADLADAELAAGHKDRARTAYERACALAPSTPQIWVRSSNFYFTIDEPTAGLTHVARALKTTPSFDQATFSNLDRFVPDVLQVLNAVGSDRRCARAYLSHLLDAGRLEPARQVWDWCWKLGFTDVPLAESYVQASFRTHRYEEAQRVWSELVAADRTDYLCPNLIFNGGFESEPTRSPLDWNISSSEQFETTRDSSVFHDGKASLRIHFFGVANINYSNAIQLIPAKAGRYQFRAWIKTSSISTNQGPEIRITGVESPSNLDLRMGPFLGTADWRLITETFTLPAGTRLIAITIVREPSKKFDNKISGLFWIDSVEMIPTPPGV